MLLYFIFYQLIGKQLINLFDHQKFLEFFKDCLELKW